MENEPNERAIVEPVNILAEIHAQTNLLLEILNTLRVLYNYQLIQSFKAPRVYVERRFTLVPGERVQITRTRDYDDATYWLISLETAAGATLAREWGELEGSEPTLVLGSGDSAKIPATSQRLILANTGAVNCAFTLIESNL